MLRAKRLSLKVLVLLPFVGVFAWAALPQGETQRLQAALPLRNASPAAADGPQAEPLSADVPDKPTANATADASVDKTLTAAGFNPAWLDQLKWRCIGPANMGGRIVDLAVVESDPFTYYVATASGGLFKTTNNGTTFTPLFDRQSTVSIGDVCVAPSDPKVIWVGTGEHNARNSVSWGDGVYKSTDGGESWNNMGLPQSFQIGRMAIHPSDPNIVYVGALGRLWGANEERGLFKTSDSGATWQKVLYVDDKTGCIDVVMHPADPNTLIAATYERQRDEFDGNDPAKRWGPGSGLYKSTDGGTTWSKLTKGLPTVHMGRIGLCYYRKDPSVVYAIIETEKIGTGKFNPAYMGISGNERTEEASLGEVVEGGPADEAGLKSGDVVAKIDDAEIKNYNELILNLRRRQAGETVKIVVKRKGADGKLQELAPLELTFGKRPDQGQQNNAPFAANLGGQRENAQDIQGADGFQTGGVYKSTDGGESWTRINSLNPRPFYYSQIHVDPSDDNHIFVLGVSLHVSADNGKTFNVVGRSAHPDHHALWIDPRDGRHVLLGCDGGLYASHDRCRTFDFHNIIAIGQFYDVGVDSRSPYRVYGGLQDNGSWGGPSRVRGGGADNADWIRVGGADGFVCRVDPGDPDLVYYEGQNGMMGRVNVRTGERARIAPRQEGPARRPAADARTGEGAERRPAGTDDGAPPPSAEEPESETEQASPRPSPRGRGGEDRGPRYRFNWKTPFLLSHHNSRIFYCGAQVVFRSLDRGNNLKAISPEITRTDRGSATALAESPHDPDVLYAGTDDGYLWITRDGGTNWTNVTEKLALPGPRWVNAIECSRFAPGRAYVVLDGHRSNDDSSYIFVTEDYGATWTSLAALAPQHSTRVLREDVQNPDLLYLGTEFGIWCSFDRGQGWHKLNNNLPTVAVHEIAVHPTAGEIVAATHGRSVWVLDVTPLRQLSSEVKSSAAFLFKPQPAVHWAGVLGREHSGNRNYRADAADNSARLLLFLTREAKDVSLKISDVSGKLVQQLEAPKQPGLHAVAWNLRGMPQRPTGPAARGSGGRGPMGRPRGDAETPQREPIAAEPEPPSGGARPATGPDGAGRGGFDPRSRFGAPVPPGQYLVTFSVDGKTYTQPLTVEADPDFPAAMLQEELQEFESKKRKAFLD